MGIEDYAQTFEEIDKCGLFSEEDRKYLIKRGILKPPRAESDICCSDCGSPLSPDVIKKISEFVIEAIYRDRERYSKLIPSKPSSIKEQDSIMFS